MKAISIKEPWASMIKDGKKTIETRKWVTKYRGKLLLCASKNPKSDIAGKAFAVAELVDVRHMLRDDEKKACCAIYEGAFSWVLDNVSKIRPFNVKGQLGLFNIDWEENLKMKEVVSKKDLNYLASIDVIEAVGAKRYEIIYEGDHVETVRVDSSEELKEYLLSQSRRYPSILALEIYDVKEDKTFSFKDISKFANSKIVAKESLYKEIIKKAREKGIRLDRESEVAGVLPIGEEGENSWIDLDYFPLKQIDWSYNLEDIGGVRLWIPSKARLLDIILGE